MFFFVPVCLNLNVRDIRYCCLFLFFFLFVRIDRIKQREKENVRDSMTFTVLSSCYHHYACVSIVLVYGMACKNDLLFVFFIGLYCFFV